MCGILGVSFLPRRRSPEMWREIRFRIRELLIEMDKRGGHGYGLAVIGRDGALQAHHRALGECGDDPFDPGLLEALAAIGPGTATVIGHCRFGTSGTKKDLPEFHPFVCGPIVGCHNGVIYNDDALTEDLFLHRESPCDSEPIFRLMERLAAKRPLDADIAVEALSQVVGSYAIAAADLRRPERLFLMPGSNPCAIDWHPELGVLFFASTMQALCDVGLLADRVQNRFRPEWVASMIEGWGIEVLPEVLELLPEEIDPKARGVDLVRQFPRIECPETDWGGWYYGEHWSVFQGHDVKIYRPKGGMIDTSGRSHEQRERELRELFLEEMDATTLPPDEVFGAFGVKSRRTKKRKSKKAEDSIRYLPAGLPSMVIDPETGVLVSLNGKGGKDDA